MSQFPYANANDGDIERMADFAIEVSRAAYTVFDTIVDEKIQHEVNRIAMAFDDLYADLRAVLDDPDGDRACVESLAGALR